MKSGQSCVRVKGSSEGKVSVGQDHANHMWIMALACGGALLLILVLPIFGLSKNWSIGISITVMVGLHLWMMQGHSDHSHHREHKGGAK